jgi:hypothetical protein
MPTRFITQADIEDLFKRGERRLEVTPDMSLTDLAYEKARQLGIQLVDATIPSAPVRPYLVNHPKAAPSKQQAPDHKKTPFTPTTKMPLDLSTSGLIRDELHKRVQAAVVRQLGGQIDEKVVDTIIRRILDSTGVR